MFLRAGFWRFVGYQGKSSLWKINLSHDTHSMIDRRRTLTKVLADWALFLSDIDYQNWKIEVHQYISR